MYGPMADDFTQCMVSNSRMAARAITRRYDSYLRPHGVTATQLSLLGGIQMLPGATVSALAEARGFERTTLIRNLDKLEQLGLVVSEHHSGRRGRMPTITPAGAALLKRLVPLWRQAQAELRAELSPDGFDDGLKTLKRLAKV
jgi:DNA-binding MarR family transcriptional regulator